MLCSLTLFFASSICVIEVAQGVVANATNDTSFAESAEEPNVTNATDATSFAQNGEEPNVTNVAIRGRAGGGGGYRGGGRNNGGGLDDDGHSDGDCVENCLHPAFAITMFIAIFLVIPIFCVWFGAGCPGVGWCIEKWHNKCNAVDKEKLMSCRQRHVGSVMSCREVTARGLAAEGECWMDGVICDQCNRPVSNIDEALKICFECRFAFCQQCFEQWQPYQAGSATTV